MTTPKKFGALLDEPIKQADSSFSIKNDGTIEATTTYKTESQYIDSLPQVGDEHPEDSRIKCYERRITYDSLDLITCACSYFGIAAKKQSDPTFDYVGGVNSDPIETHNRFNNIAGDSTTPQNGARFDEQTNEFLGFAGADAGKFAGVSNFLTPAVNVNVTYWTTEKPDLSLRMKQYDVPEIGKDIFRKMPTVKNYLLVDMPYRQVGDLYQVTEQYMGSGDRGWIPKIYPKGGAR